MKPMTQKLLARFALVFLLLNGIAFSQSKPYRGAEYRTKESYTYGRFEVRMKSAAGSGILTTLFTYHDSSPFSVANWNEIDIEIMGRYSNEVQYNTITPNRIDHVRRQVVKFNPHLSFHVHAFEWTPDYVAWFVDGYEVYRQTEAHVATLTRPQKIMMNMWQPTAVAWAGAFDPNTLPFYGYYDWVKYYAYTPGEGDNFTLQWTDNFDNWDQSRWDKATHTFDGNNAQFIHDNIVFRNGYMILCLTTPEATGYRGGTIIDLDINPPYLVWARAEANRFLAFFSEEVEKVSAETISNYTIAGATIQSASLQPGNKVVALQTDSLDLTQSFEASCWWPAASKIVRRQRCKWACNSPMLPTAWRCRSASISAARAKPISGLIKFGIIIRNMALPAEPRARDRRAQRFQEQISPRFTKLSARD
ncbi:hypothetical protein DCC62_28620 [candidate division KSB1 bacterium]|nr:MAG: hypothetical protein DCC62_28620 [candidate division KSB1 bacterium]